VKQKYNSFRDDSKISTGEAKNTVNHSSILNRDQRPAEIGEWELTGLCIACLQRVVIGGLG